MSWTELAMFQRRNRLPCPIPHQKQHPLLQSRPRPLRQSTSGDDQATTPRKSSLALRDQIAKAKAAKRAAAAKQVPIAAPSTGEEVSVIPTDTFDFGLSDDPFNQQINQNGAKGLLRKRIDSARTDGRLNIAAMGFKEIPEEVMNMYSLESVGAQDGTWAESVDLTRFVAADNELEMIADHIFPDTDPRDAADDEDAKGNQFGGESLLWTAYHYFAF